MAEYNFKLSSNFTDLVRHFTIGIYSPSLFCIKKSGIEQYNLPAISGVYVRIWHIVHHLQNYALWTGTVWQNDPK